VGVDAGSHFNRTRIKTTRARRLRRDGTAVERRLWHKLRNAQIGGASFRRQYPTGPYILDFYCAALQLSSSWMADSMHKRKVGTDNATNG
jgi:very-short-patch-repair endonuclease